MMAVTPPVPAASVAVPSRARAWAATRLARLKRPQDPFSEWLNRADRRRVIEVLTRQVRQRTLDKDWMYHGLDGAMAIRAFGDLGADETLPVLREAFFRVDPALKGVENPNFGPNPLSWTDFRPTYQLRGGSKSRGIYRYTP